LNLGIPNQKNRSIKMIYYNITTGRMKGLQRDLQNLF